MHPDGKRAAVLAGESVTIFDIASKKATLTFPLRKKGDGTVSDNEITNSPMNLWLAGETAFIYGSDAGPAAALFPYSLKGNAIGPAYWSVYLGGVAIDDDKLVLNEEALTKLTILDGVAKKGKTVVRKVPKGPCTYDDPELEIPADYRPGTDKCKDYLFKHWLPYTGAQIVSDGKGYLGLQGTELFALDGKLAETRRVKLQQCTK
jgi:hypothetical protein